MKVKPDDLAIFKPSKIPSVYLIKSKSFGSGKITRRVEIDSALYSVRKKSRVRKAKREKREYASGVVSSNQRKQPFLSDQKVNFKHQGIRILFDFWNTLKHPFTQHQKKRSKTTTKIIALLTPITKKYEQRQIVDAIDVGHRLFSDKRFVYHFAYGAKKIEFHTFLRHSAKQQRYFESWHAVKVARKQHGIALPTSWFNECLKGWQYVEKNYCRETGIEDKHPEVTKQAIKMMEIHRPGRPINDKGINDIIKFVKMLFNYAELNKMDPYWLYDRIESALNSYHTISIEKTHYLTTEIFWSDTLPNELIRFDRRGFENRELICDRGKLVK